MPPAAKRPSTRYIAFLRAINVRGHAIIKMTDLRDAFMAAGCGNVTTFIQSGNVIFDTPAEDPAALFRRINAEVRELAGGEPAIVYRTARELEALARSSPFKGLEGTRQLKLYVTFLDRPPLSKPSFPMHLAKDALEAIGMKGLDVLLVSRPKPNGFYGFPNNFIEKVLGVSGTSRNWTTVTKILALTRQDLSGPTR
ncbi:MAG TPA: DUF1697 domain-containing protein [Vicinamibacterales bacterium]|nr:DUF1697 domain-containing protein [Vicinamibacterales bacterium]